MTKVQTQKQTEEESEISTTTVINSWIYTKESTMGSEVPTERISNTDETEPTEPKRVKEEMNSNEPKTPRTVRKRSLIKFI